MAFNTITETCLLVFDTLRNDKESAELIDKLNSAEDDSELKECLQEAVKRLDIVNPNIAKMVRKHAKGFAF